MKAALALVAMLTVAVADSAALWAGQPAPIVLAVELGGAFVLDGIRYTDEKTVAAKLKEILRRKPVPVVQYRARSIDDISRLTRVAQQAGIPKISFLIEPKAN